MVRKDHYNQDETFYCGPDSLGSLGSLPLDFVFHMSPVAHKPSPAISHTYKLSENKCHVIKVSGTICISIWCYGNMVFRFYELLVSNGYFGQSRQGSRDVWIDRSYICFEKILNGSHLKPHNTGAQVLFQSSNFLQLPQVLRLPSSNFLPTCSQPNLGLATPSERVVIC